MKAQKWKLQGNCRCCSPRRDSLRARAAPTLWRGCFKATEVPTIRVSIKVGVLGVLQNAW